MNGLAFAAIAFHWRPLPMPRKNLRKQGVSLRHICLCGSALALLACGSPNIAVERGVFGQDLDRSADTAVAQVEGTIIYKSDIERMAAEQGLIAAGAPLVPSDETFKTVLEELIDQRLLALDAVNDGLLSDRETQLRIAAAEERILGNIRVETYLRDRVNETTIRRLYEEQAALADRGPEIRARHILVADKAKAKEVLAKIEAGEEFGALARTKSIDAGTRERGGDLGYFSKDMLEDDFTKPVFATEVGKRTSPFETEFGWHIVEVLDKRPARAPKFEQMRPQIVNFMTFDAIQNLLKELRKDGEVERLLSPAPETITEDAPIEETPADE